ncbi:hypothetical protein ACP275_09G110100 [Erythranthe tilingii]
MDRGRSVRAITAITVLVLLCAGQATASCYGDCLHDCFAEAKELTVCLITCIFKCKKVELADDPCKFNCAINRCSRFGTACFNDCTTNQRKDIPTCGLQCLNQCLASSPPDSNKIHYCKLGCAIDECAGFSNDADKMDDCVTK